MKLTVALKSGLLAALVLLTDYYVAHPSLRVTTLLLILLALASMLISNPLKRIKEGTVAVLLAATAFLSYMFLVDWFRSGELLDPLIKYISGILIILTLPIFENRQDGFRVFRHLRLYLYVSILFALVQFSGHAVNLATLAPSLSFIQADELIPYISEQYYGVRTTGATSNTIAFAEQLLILLFYHYATFFRTHSPAAVIQFAFAFLVLLTTQTRAAIFGLIPAIVLARIMTARHHLQEFVRLLPFLTAIGLTYFAVTGILSGQLGYLAKEIDMGDTHRFWTNYYMAIGVLNESPIFGIAPSQAWDIYFRYADFAFYGFNPEVDTPTHHNQLGFYMRYYGLAGIAMLTWLYIVIFRKIFRSRSIWIQIVLASLFIVDFIYSMGHNNKLVASPLLWILLSLASVDPRKERDPY